MTLNLLDYFLMSQLSAIAIIFVRVGAAVMVLPGFGEIYVPPRIRLLFALIFSLLLTPLLQARMPMLPSSPVALGILLGGEVLIGAFIGLIARAALLAVHAAGNIIALQSSLAVAAIFDPQSGGQNALISNLLTLAAMTLFFSLNLHHLVIAALVQSYDVFPAGQPPPVADMNTLHLRLVADSFALGVALAAPHIVVGLLFYLIGGLMTRLMPNFQIFFVMMSPQILIAFFLLMALASTMLGIFSNFLEEQYLNFVSTQ